MQNEDAEINLQFEDYDNIDNFSNDRSQRGQTVYFSSFPDSAEDDQEQKLLDDDETEESRSKPTHSFWTFEYYQQFFDVESKQVGDRILWSMVPKPGVNYLQSYIRPNPDLYGPFWICVTLVFTSAIAGNLSSYLQSPDYFHWRYNFHKVTLATSSIFSYAWFVPLLIWGILLWKGSNRNLSLLELICLYGYSLAIFVPVSLLWVIPLRWLQWCLGIVASVLSGGVLVRTIQPAIKKESKNIAIGLAVFVLVLHAVLALGFMVYFFFPSNEASFVDTKTDNKSTIAQADSHNVESSNVMKSEDGVKQFNKAYKAEGNDGKDANIAKKEDSNKTKRDEASNGQNNSPKTDENRSNDTTNATVHKQNITERDKPPIDKEKLVKEANLAVVPKTISKTVNTIS